MLRTFRFQLRPTGHQAQTLTQWLAVSCELYNAALEERRDAWKLARQRITYEDQTAELTELRELCPDIREVPADIAREPLRRIDRAFQAFFRRCKAGGRPGYPRFRSRERYDSLAFSAVAFEGNSVRVPKLGCVRFRQHREIKGQPKTCILHRAPGGQKWSVSVTCDLGPAPEKLPVTTAMGMDVGLARFVTLSDGRAIEKPNWARKADQKIAAANRSLARKRRGSRNRAKARIALQREYQRAANQRLNFCHHVSKFLVSTYDLIAFEALRIQAMTQGLLAKSILDAAWGILLGQIAYKAEEAGKWAVPVDPRGTSQRCAKCGCEVPKTLDERVHRCPCGFAADRDHNAALNILALGRSAAGLAPPMRSSDMLLNHYPSVGSEPGRFVMGFRKVLLTLFCALIVVATMRAQNEPKKTDTARFGDPTSTARGFQDYLFGVVKKIDTRANELVLDKTKFGIDQTVKLELKTKYVHDGKPSALAHLKEGDQVYVDVRKDKKTGDMVAKKVITGVAPTPSP